ncbi:MAG: META domain-containing protein [Hyphomonadaceae bacterium]
MLKHLVLAAALGLAACADTVEAPVAPTESPLPGSRWVATIGGVHAPTIEFTENRATGNTGCNNWFGQVTSAPPAMTFGAIGTTRRACEQPIMDIERHFLRVLEETQTASIDGDVLVLSGANGELARFTRAR